MIEITSVGDGEVPVISLSAVEEHLEAIGSIEEEISGAVCDVLPLLAARLGPENAEHLDARAVDPAHVVRSVVVDVTG